jgi:hypothetical protein
VTGTLRLLVEAWALSTVCLGTLLGAVSAGSSLRDTLRDACRTWTHGRTRVRAHARSR